MQTPGRDTLRQRVQARISASEQTLFLRKDFKDLGSYDEVGRALRQLVQSNHLLRISSGVYVRCEISPIDGKLAPLNDLTELTEEAFNRLAGSGRAIDAKAYPKPIPTGRAISLRERVRHREE